MSSWIDEDEDGDTHASSPALLSTGGRRRRHSSSQHRVWMPLPHFAGKGHSMNPIPYSPQLNFPPPPIMAPVPLGVPPPYPMLPPPVAAPAAPAPVTTRVAAAPLAWANMVNTPAPTAQPVGDPIRPPQAPVVVAGGAPNPMPPLPLGSIQGRGSIVDFDNMSIDDSLVSSAPSVQAPRQCQWVPGGGFHLPDLASLTDTVTYEMWKNTIGYFHLSGHTDELIMPIVYQSIKGDVALDIVTHGPHLNLCELIAHLDNNFGVVSDEDTLMKELYTIKQGPKEPVKCFDTWIGYAMMKLAVAFLHVMPAAQAEEIRKTCFLSRLHPNLKSTLAWEMCLDGGRCQMTYEEIKDATKCVEQREDPSMSDDPFVRDNAFPTSWDDGQQDCDCPTQCNQGCPQYGGYTCQPNHGQPTARAVNMEEPRIEDHHDGVDDCELDGGGGDMGFDPSDYEGIEELPSTVPTTSLLPPHVKAAWIAYHYEQQE